MRISPGGSIFRANTGSRSPTRQSAYRQISNKNKHEWASLQKQKNAQRVDEQVEEENPDPLSGIETEEVLSAEEPEQPPAIEEHKDEDKQ